MQQRTPKEIGEEIRQFTADNVALEAKLPGLLKSHPMQWAGMRDGELRIAPTLDGLVELFGGNGSRVAHQFLNPNPKTLILAIGEGCS